MNKRKKKALLDSDFIIKTVNTKSEDVKFIDFFMRESDYEFVCHEKIIFEVSEHNDDAKLWLQDKIDKGVIKKYSDKDIFDEMFKIYHNVTKFKFVEFIKNSCNYISSTCFDDNYNLLSDVNNMDDDTFLSNIKICENELGKGKSIGERKSMLLLQMLLDFYPNNTYYFCSDDKGARRGIISITSQVQCISILTIFNKLSSKNIDRLLIRNYYNSFVEFINRINSDQTQFKVFKKNGKEIIKVDFNNVIEDLLNDKFISLANGFLQYK